MEEEIIHELDELAHKTQECGFNNIAIVLFSLLASMSLKTDGHLAEICQGETRKNLQLINEYKASMN